MRQLTVDWVAGFFDGEGCISVRVDNRTFSVTIEITLTNTNRDIMIAIQEQFGGVLYEQKRYSDKHKSAHRLKWYSTKAIAFLETIKDHLVLKKDIAENALRLFDKSLPNSERVGAFLGIKIANRRGA